MVGTTVRALRLAILILLSAGTAIAGPVTSYDCAPGTPVKGVGCSCPKSYKGKAYTPKRDAADPGRAICAVASSRPYRARGNYTQLVEQANNYADAYNCTKAEESYQQALKVNPRGLEALVGSGNCMVRERKWTNAHMRFDRALAIDRKYEPALWGKAEAYRLAYKKDDAIAAYRQYLDAYPNSYKGKQALEKLSPGPTPIITTPPVVSPGRYPTRTEDVTIAISGSQITCNGVQVSGTPRLSDFEAIYGKPDRVWDTKGGVNKVHTWDRLGLVVYEPKDGRAISATFPFNPMGMAYDPSTMFRGSITVDGYALSRTTSLGSVKNRPGATQPYSSTSVVIAKGDFNVFVTGRNGPLDLVELSLWKRSTTNPTGGGKYKNTRDVRVVVSGTRVTMNGVTISGRPMLADIEKIYGKPDRTWDTGASNRVHTWDNLGIVVYEPRDGRCISTTFPYKPMGSSYDPSTMFGGSIIVDGRSMSKFLTISTVNSRPGATQPYGKNSIVFDKGDIHVFTISKKGGPIDLVEISYWQRDKSGASLGGGNTSTSGGRVTSAKDVQVEVVGTTIKLQGVAISGKPRVSDIIAIYGKPDRVWDKKGSPNRIHTWDNLGFIVYEPHDGRAISLTMPFKSMNNTFSPRTLFKGRVSLDRRGFYNFNTIGTIKRRKGATQPYGATSVVFDLGDIHVFTTAAKATTSTIDLVEISFWQHK